MFVTKLFQVILLKRPVTYILSSFRSLRNSWGRLVANLYEGLPRLKSKRNTNNIQLCNDKTKTKTRISFIKIRLWKPGYDWKPLWPMQDVVVSRAKCEWPLFFLRKKMHKQNRISKLPHLVRIWRLVSYYLLCLSLQYLTYEDCLKKVYEAAEHCRAQSDETQLSMTFVMDIKKSWKDSV